MGVIGQQATGVDVPLWVWIGQVAFIGFMASRLMRMRRKILERGDLILKLKAENDQHRQELIRLVADMEHARVRLIDADKKITEVTAQLKTAQTAAQARTAAAAAKAGATTASTSPTTAASRLGVRGQRLGLDDYDGEDEDEDSKPKRKMTKAQERKIVSDLVALKDELQGDD